jgi:hypothetical protein
MTRVPQKIKRGFVARPSFVTCAEGLVFLVMLLLCSARIGAQQRLVWSQSSPSLTLRSVEDLQGAFEFFTVNGGLL